MPPAPVDRSCSLLFVGEVGIAQPSCLARVRRKLQALHPTWDYARHIHEYENHRSMSSPLYKTSVVYTSSQPLCWDPCTMMMIAGELCASHDWWANGVECFTSFLAFCRQGLKIYSNTPYTIEQQLTTMTKTSGAKKMKHRKPAAIQKQKTQQRCIMGRNRNGKLVVLERALQRACNHHVTEHEVSLHYSTSQRQLTRKLSLSTV